MYRYEYIVYHGIRVGGKVFRYLTATPTWLLKMLSFACGNHPSYYPWHFSVSIISVEKKELYNLVNLKRLYHHFVRKANIFTSGNAVGYLLPLTKWHPLISKSCRCRSNSWKSASLWHRAEKPSFLPLVKNYYY
jgi:hypothetical protein